MIPESQQDRDNEREMNKADKNIEMNKEIENGLVKCSECGVLYDPAEGRATKCRSCYQYELNHNEAEYHKMRRGFGEY